MIYVAATFILFFLIGNLYRKAASNPVAGQGNPLAYTAIEDADISKAID